MRTSKSWWFPNLVKKIQIYANDEDVPMPLTSITLNFPVFRDNREINHILWDKNGSVEAVCLLSKLNTKQPIEVDIQRAKGACERSPHQGDLYTPYKHDYAISPSWNAGWANRRRYETTGEKQIEQDSKIRCIPQGGYANEMEQNALLREAKTEIWIYGEVLAWKLLIWMKSNWKL